MEKSFLLSLLLVSKIVSAQNASLKLLSETRDKDNKIVQIAEFKVYNNTPHPLCLKISTWFLSNLEKDTIELVSRQSSQSCSNFYLEIAKKDLVDGVIVEEYPSYPLILYSYTAFVAIVKLKIEPNCKESRMDFTYISLRDYDGKDLIEQFKSGKQWGTDPKLKFIDRSIPVIFSRAE